MKSKKRLVICIAIPLAVGGLSWLLSQGGMDSFQELRQPPLSPPGWLFPVVWTVLYVLMGIASYLVVTKGEDPEAVRKARQVYGLQLAVNFFWSILFFRFELYWIAFLWLVLLWALILVTIVRFERISPVAAGLLTPYLLWVTFAGYLNAAIAFLN